MRRTQKEPADKAYPDTVQYVATEELEYAPENEEVGDNLAHHRGYSRRCTQATINLPDDRAQHPSSIKWETRNQIEDTQQDVGNSQVAQYRFQR